MTLESYFQFDVTLRENFKLHQHDGFHGFLTNNVVVTNDQLVFIYHEENILDIYDIHGNNNRKIRLSGEPQNVLVVNDNHVAVSYRYGMYIEIISTDKEQVENTIPTRDDIAGMTYQDGLMYVVIDNKIDVMNMTGEIIRSFECPFHYMEICLSSTTDSLILFCLSTNILYCCDFNGSIRWRLTVEMMDLDFMMRYGNITTDRKGNIYMTCTFSNNVVVVSPDGKHYKELLTDEDGLDSLGGIYYDKSNDCLLVYNFRYLHTFLFDVKHSVQNE